MWSHFIIQLTFPTKTWTKLQNNFIKKKKNGKISTVFYSNAQSRSSLRFGSYPILGQVSLGVGGGGRQEGVDVDDFTPGPDRTGAEGRWYRRRGMIHLCRACRVCVWVSAGKQSECHAVPDGGIQTLLGRYSDALPLKTNTAMHATIIWEIWKYHSFPFDASEIQELAGRGGNTLLDIVPRY